MNISVRFSNGKQKKRLIARAIGCGLLLTLPSCQIPALRQAEPGPGLPSAFRGTALPDSYSSSSPLTAVVGGLGVAVGAGNVGIANIDKTASSESSGQLAIEQFYSDTVLTGLINQALTSNRELLVLNQEVQVAGNEILARQGSYLPFVTFGANTGIEKPSRYTRDGAVENELNILPNRAFPNPLPNYMLGFNLFWELDIWRELRNARDAAAQRYTAAIERRNDFVTRLVAEVADNYFSLLALDQRLRTLDQIINYQEQSLRAIRALFDAGRGNELAVQRFQAEVRKNQSEKLIVTQEIIETENRINFRVNRFPQPVERSTSGFYDLSIPLSVGYPAQLLQNRPDIRQAERELAAAGLDVKVARAHFFPSLSIRSGVGYEAFNPKYLFNPEALVYNVLGELTAPVINKKAIQAEYLSANARQLESVYNYQRVILNAFTEVVNRVSMVENYGKSIEIKKQQLASLEAAVDAATKLFQAARAEYLEILTVQRDLLEARTVLIETKRQQLTAIVNTYQALGGGSVALPIPLPPPPKTRFWRW